MSIPGSASPLFFQTAAGAGGYEIERSLRFNDDESASLTRTFSTSSTATWTWSGWVKRCSLGTNQALFSAGSYTIFGFNTLDGLRYERTSNATNAVTAQLFRDTSAWYHIVLVAEAGAATSDKLRIYVNGSRADLQVATGLGGGPDINTNIEHSIGKYSSTRYFDGYLADVHFIDGQALAPTDFGEFDDNGVWQPIEYAGTYGTNGFKLNFSDNSSNAALGDDSSGNSNDWTVNNLINAGGDVVRTTELSVNHASGVISQPGNAFNPTYISNYINTSTFAVTNAAWLGSYANGYAEARWIPVGGYAVTNSLRVYFGVYSNAAASSTLTVTYTDATTESSSQFTSGNNNWMTLFTASNAAGKTIQKIEISNPSTTNVQFGGFVIDDQIVETANTDTDSLLDSPTNGTQTDTGAGGQVSGNYATLNPLEKHNTLSPVFSNGNLEITDTGQTGYNNAFSTIGVSSGKWYVECTNTVGAFNFVGIQQGPVTGGYIGNDANGWGYAAEGYLRHNSTNKAYGSVTYGNGDVIGIALDLDSATKTLTFYKNGTSLGIAYSGSELDADVYHFGGTLYTTNDKQVWNFGQRAFAYTAPSGFKALCTANLPDPTIADGSDHFDIATYGGGASSYTISGLSFSPDLVWSKRRDSAGRPALVDTVRGATIQLSSDRTAADLTISDGLEQFNSDGYVVGTDAGEYGWNGGASSTFVNWIWNAGTSTVSNTDGTITSSVRANPSAGFSIVGYTGNGVGAATIGHGLNVAPSMVIIKQRDQADNWVVGHTSQGWSSVGFLNLTNAWGVISYFNNTAPASTTFQLSGSAVVNGNGYDYIAYCFAPVEGYSAFGSYTGNGSADGPFVYTGFRPRWILVKGSSTSGLNWCVFDTSRDGYNGNNAGLFPNSNVAESYYVNDNEFDIYSNGFKPVASRNHINNSGTTFIYYAVAENPFKTARAR